MRIIFRFGKKFNDWDSIKKSIEKSFSHKYIKRIPKPTGKGWYYIYAETFKKPLKALAEIFGITEKKVDVDYQTNNIKKDYGVDKQTFAAHVLEFFTNKEKWNNIFSKKKNRDKYKKPVEQKELVYGAISKIGADAEQGDLFAEKKEKVKKENLINRSLMRKVWAIYSLDGKRIEQQEKGEKSIAPKEIKENFDLLNDVFKNGKVAFVKNKEVGKIAVEMGSTGKNGYGIKHIIEQRYSKDNMTVDEITSLCGLIIQTAKDGKVTRETKQRIELQTDNGIVIIIRKPNDKKYNWILTGFDNWNKKQEATDAIKTVSAENSYALEGSDFRNQVGAVISSLHTSIPQNEEKSSDSLSESMKGNQNAKKWELTDVIDTEVKIGRPDSDVNTGRGRITKGQAKAIADNKAKEKDIMNDLHPMDDDFKAKIKAENAARFGVQKSICYVTKDGRFYFRKSAFTASV